MSARRPVYIGTDGGATTSKIAGVWQDGSSVSTDLLQKPTNSQLGPDGVVRGWVESINEYLAQNDLSWEQVQGVGVAIAGPRRSYGVLEQGPNFPDSFIGFDVQAAFGGALAAKAGRKVQLFVGNDGNTGGIAEAQRVRQDGKGTVLMLAPGSGLGCAYIGRDGLPLEGDTLAGMEGAHMPAPLHLLNAPVYPCGCGRDWGCVEAYTTISGLPHLLADKLKEYPDHELAKSAGITKEKVLSLRGLAQKGDELAIAIFDFQARAIGLHIANLAMALDPQYVVIGGGLMDEGATTKEFRERYLRIAHEAALPYLWPAQRERLQIVPATLGDLSQAIGAALLALYESLHQ